MSGSIEKLPRPNPAENAGIDRSGGFLESGGRFWDIFYQYLRQSPGNNRTASLRKSASQSDGGTVRYSTAHPVRVFRSRKLHSPRETVTPQ